MSAASPSDPARPWNARRLRDPIRLAIIDSQHTGDGLLPSESDLMRQFGASRTTVRDVLALLVDEGQIERRRGQGTSRVLSYSSFDVTIPHGAEEESDYAQLVTQTVPVVLHRGWTVAPRPIAGRLSGVSDGDRCLALEYVVTVQGIPQAVFTNYMRQREALRLDGVPFDKGFYTLLRRAGVDVSDQSSTFQARRADAETARILDIPSGSPVLDHHQILANTDGDIFNVSFGAVRDHVRLTGRGSARLPIT